MSEHTYAGGVGYADVSSSNFAQVNRQDSNRAREAAEALFAPKRPVADAAVPDPVLSTDRLVRKPRILSVSGIKPSAVEQVETPVKPEPPRLSQQIPASHRTRIRTWLKYGMTVRQAAEVYGVSVGEIERILERNGSWGAESVGAHCQSLA